MTVESDFQQSVEFENLRNEIQHLDTVFSKNSYSAAFIKHNTYTPNDQTDKSTDRPKPATTATIPYIKGTSETIARILQPIIQVFKFYYSYHFTSSS